MRVRLTALELESFRGFAAPQEVDLDADVVLVRGDNGTGKTSLVDGLTWLFAGEVPRLTERSKGFRRGADPILNAFAGKEARVRLSLLGPDGRPLAFERTGNSNSNALEAWEGDKQLRDAEVSLARCFGELPFPQLADAVGTWGILQQHSISAALQSGATMHERLSSVVGLGRVSAFADSAGRTARAVGGELRRCRQLQTDLSQRQADLQAELTKAEAALADPAAAEAKVQDAVAEALAGLPDGLRIEVDVRTPNGVAALIEEIERIAVSAATLAAREAEAQAEEAAVGPAVAEIEAELAELQRRGEEAVKEAPLQVQLASAAVDLLGPTCPVCGQEIDADQVRAHLEHLLQASQAALASAAETRAAISAAQSRALAAQEAERRRARALAMRELAAQELRDALGTFSALRLASDWHLPGAAGRLADAAATLAQRMREIHDLALSEQGAQIERLSSEARSLAADLAEATAELAAAEQRLRQAQSLDRAAKEAAERIIRRAIEKIEPSFAEVFDRLSPHPAFTELRAGQDIFYGRNQIVPEVHDPESGVTANPQLVFSEGQFNVVALSYFLGLALNSREGSLPFLVLDDPMQQMDVVAVLGFADLCRRLREHRQLLVTTHDRRFAALLERKLAPRLPDSRTILHEFDGWTRDGPRIESSEEPLAEVVPLLDRRAS